MSVSICLLVARAKDGVIGLNNDLPWHLPEDLKFFKAKTVGKPVVMGRRTYESILARLGKPLPGRPSFVVSRSGYTHEGAQTYSDVEQALKAAVAWAEANGSEEIFLIGGAALFEAGLPYVDTAYITEIDQNYPGDAFFAFSGQGWTKDWEEAHEGFAFTRWRRLAPTAGL